jgi:hypothetical protein
MEGGRKIDGKYLVPFLNREGFYWSDMLNAGVIDDDVNRSETMGGLIGHPQNGIGTRHVGIAISDIDIMRGGKRLALHLDVVAVAETIEHHGSAGFGECLGDTKADTARGAGDDRSPTFQRTADGTGLVWSVYDKHCHLRSFLGFRCLELRQFRGNNKMPQCYDFDA